MQSKKSRSVTHVVLGIVLSFWMISLAGVISGQEQELKTLKLVNTYQSEAEFQAAYPDLFPKRIIQDDGEMISFHEPASGKLLKQIRKNEPEAFSSEEKARFAKSDQRTPVTKTTYSYELTTDSSLMLYTEWKTWFNSETDVTKSSPEKRLLYNAQGEVITELPSEVNVIKICPDHQHFLAYGEDEVPSKYLYVYTTEGTLVSREENNAYTMAAYSQEGEFFSVFDSFGNHFAIYSKNGKRVYENDYTKLPGVNPILYGVFVSEHGDSFLLQTSGKLSLFTLNNTLLWERAVPPQYFLLGCRFDTAHNLILLASSGEEQRVVNGRNQAFYKLEVASLDSGRSLESIGSIAYIRLLKNAIIVQKEGVYYEYQIQ